MEIEKKLNQVIHLLSGLEVYDEADKQEISDLQIETANAIHLCLINEEIEAKRQYNEVICPRVDALVQGISTRDTLPGNPGESSNQ